MEDTKRAQKVARWTTWGLLGVVLLEFGGILALEAAGCKNLFNPASPEPALAYGLLLLPLNGLGFSILGTLIINSRSGNRIGWLTILIGLGIMTGFLGTSYSACTLNGRLDLPWATQALMLDHISNILFLPMTLFPWLFPDGSFLSTRWRRMGLVLLGITLPFTLAVIIWPGPIQSLLLVDQEVYNPIALPIPTTPFWDNFVNLGDTLTFLGLIFVGIFTLFLRWRRSSGVVRQQMKWLTFFLMTAGALFIAVEVIGETFYPPIFEGWFYLLELTLFWLGFPVVLGFAILRYRLYDIDVIIRRTLIYAALTGTLAVVYFLTVILLQRYLPTQTQLTTVLSTLTIAALFSPLRRRIQNDIDRLFFRRRYDTEQTLAAFSNRTRNEVDLEELHQGLLEVVEETMQPVTVSLWLKDVDL